MSAIRHSRATSTFIPYPAVIKDRAILDSLGLIPGTSPDENPPKVIMTQADWAKLVSNPKTARAAIDFQGDTWETNPLLKRPKHAQEDNAESNRGTKPNPSFARYKGLPTNVALDQAQADHTTRMTAGMPPEDSLAILLRALDFIKRQESRRERARTGDISAAVAAVKPKPLAVVGQLEDNSAPLRDHFVVRHKREKGYWTAVRTVVDEAFTLQAHEPGLPDRTVRPRELYKAYEKIGA